MLNELLTRYPGLKESEKEIALAVKQLIACYENEGKLLLCGNGGSAADCQHISGELMKSFLADRSLSQEQKLQMKQRFPDIDENILSKLQGGLPAVSLPCAVSLCSAFCNDVDPELVYAQGVMALGRQGDVLLAISTSGSSVNVVNAAITAKALGLDVIALTGADGGKLKAVSDICICVPEKQTYKAQELHLPVYHYICAQTEAHFFPEKETDL